jgi:hypothetical protein
MLWSQPLLGQGRRGLGEGSQLGVRVARLGHLRLGSRVWLGEPRRRGTQGPERQSRWEVAWCFGPHGDCYLLPALSTDPTGTSYPGGELDPGRTGKPGPNGPGGARAAVGRGLR